MESPNSHLKVLALKVDHLYSRGAQELVGEEAEEEEEIFCFFFESLASLGVTFLVKLKGESNP